MATLALVSALALISTLTLAAALALAATLALAAALALATALAFAAALALAAALAFAAALALAAALARIAALLALRSLTLGTLALTSEACCTRAGTSVLPGLAPLLALSCVGAPIADDPATLLVSAVMGAPALAAEHLSQPATKFPIPRSALPAILARAAVVAEAALRAIMAGPAAVIAVSAPDGVA
ncbi:MAG: hypothetical protein U1E62_07825 [Alsobacter sp.]